MISGYQPLTKEDEELFEQYSKSIDKKVRETFPSIPSSFKLKPVTIRRIVGCGLFYDIKIALPDGQFAKVSFHSGGHPGISVDGREHNTPKEPTFDVDPTASESANE